MSNGITLSEAKEHRAVEEVCWRDDQVYLRVRPYGNAVLFNNLAQSSHIRLQNVATLNGGTDLKVNVKPLGDG